MYTLFIVYIKTDDIYKDVAKDAETRFDTNCELNRPLSKGKIRKEYIYIDCIKENHKGLVRNNKSILKTLEMFKSERRNFFTEETNKIVLSSNDDKRMQSIDSIETYAYRTSKDLESEKKCLNSTI